MFYQVVTSIEHWDEVAHEIYFQATKENSPGERHLYKVNLLVFYSRVNILLLTFMKFFVQVTDFQSGQPGLVTCLSCQELNTRYILTYLRRTYTLQNMFDSHKVYFCSWTALKGVVRQNLRWVKNWISQ